MSSFLVHARPFEDVGEENESGTFDFHYVGTLFDFDFGSKIYVVRQYDESPEEASLLGLKQGEKQVSKLFDSVPYSVPYKDGDFAAVASYLRQEQGIKSLQVLTRRGYEQVDMDKLL